MSNLTDDIILVVASILSISPIVLLIRKVIKTNNGPRDAYKIIVESKSGVRIELDLHKQNDTKKIHQTVEMLQGK